MLRDSVVVVVVVRTRPRAIPLAMIAIRKILHVFPFPFRDAYGAPLGGPSGRRSSAIIQALSWDTFDARRLRAKSTLMYKILNDDTAPNLRNSFVRRNVDQTDYHLRNSANTS